MKHIRLYIIPVMLILAAGQSCRMDYTDPGGLAPAQATGSATALTSVAVGLQRLYTLGQQSPLYATVTANGFTTGELLLMNQGNLPEYQLSLGGSNVDGSNTVTANIWTYSNKIILDADNVLAGAANIGDKAYASGLIGYTSIFKALAIGNQAQYWESVVDVRGTVTTNATFVGREAGLQRAVKVLSDAQALIAATPISTAFLSRIPAGIDIPNTLAALKARYSLSLKKYDDALAAANQVVLTSKSVFNYEAANPNPIFATATATNNVYQVAGLTLGLSGALLPDPADKRLAFYAANAPLDATGKPIAPDYRIGGFARSTTTAFPVYLPGEMTLIKAECYVLGSKDLDKAVAELDKILTKKPAADPFGIGADLPAYAGAQTEAALLQEIYQNRCIELYMSGLKLDDSRRLNRPQAERKRNFLPYPFAERDNNPNTPPNPAL